MELKVYDRVRQLDTGGLGTVLDAAVSGNDMIIQVLFDDDPVLAWILRRYVSKVQ